ncbi:F-box/WD repeat-containing protein 8 isoform X1 [Trachemys scripta elegans]|uniref:F-box/WD repeat-containing protein 8 isoform X1 n=1 Tax=Trachemys scripta elegans TaxID=31138 RepID=UPI001557EAE1|nr:F-box/WD repeat-containing protein 8 isoform X1 [Trachemys scripta elegans]
MAAGSSELELFRRRWRAELAGARQGKKRRRAAEPGGSPSCREPVSGWSSCGGVPLAAPRDGGGEEERREAGYFALARSLLDGKAPGVRSRRHHRQPRPGPPPPPVQPAAEPEGGGDNDLLGQLIRDLNEINEVPFFDIQLPYELALKIFQYLGRTELGRCAQVSRTWKVLAEDEVLWYRLCQQEGYLPDASISDCSGWKLALQDCRAKERTLRTNWKNRVGAVSQLQYELGKVLCDVHSCDGVAIAGYTSGDVRLWDTRTWDYTAPILEPVHGSADPGPQPHVSFVRINSSLAVAAYEDGTVNVWSLMIGREPIHHYQHNQRIQALALGLEGAAIATASGFQVKVESPDDRGYWQTTAQFEIQKLVNFLHLVPDVVGSPVTIAAAEDMVYLLKAEESCKVLHSVYGQPVTCLDVSASEAAFGVKGFGWLLNETNKILLYNLETGQCLTKLGSSLGDFTCVNLQNSPPWMLVTGNKDRRVRVYDLRRSKSLCSLYAHHLGVSAVQMDDWKIVSGGEEGLVCVWDQRMGTKLWEMHARHPVRHIWFNTHSLITANIPDEKNPRGASIMDDDLTAHRRHRGIIYAYEFSVDQLARESVLPICRSSYDEVTGYNYNIGLAVPYDNILVT